MASRAHADSLPDAPNGRVQRVSSTYANVSTHLNPPWHTRGHTWRVTTEVALGLKQGRPRPLTPARESFCAIPCPRQERDDEAHEHGSN
eukprot:13762649-Alexandrium_andersonii.AAC.1